MGAGYNQHKSVIQWTPELIERVKAMWQTMSGRAIATALGFPNMRTAIIGKMKRLGIPPKPRLPRNRPQLRQRKPKAHRPGLDMPVDVPAAGVPYFETRHGQCRWIISEWPAINPADIQCCGQQVVTGHSWCAVHCGMAYAHWSSRGLLRTATQSEPQPVSYRPPMLGLGKLAGPRALDKLAESRQGPLLEQ